MLVYVGDKKQFLEDVDSNQIDLKIEKEMFEKLHKRVSKSERASWMNSLNYMKTVLSDEKIPFTSGVAIEFSIPFTSNRVDFILTGFDENEKHNAVIVELKQWSEVHPLEGVDKIIQVDPEAEIRHVKTYLGGGLHKTTHPSYQASSYKSLINDYNLNVQQIPITLNSCAYLHNYYKDENSDPLFAPWFDYYLKDSPLFCRSDVERLKDFIKKYIKKGDDKETLYYIDNGIIKPSKSLQDVLANMLKGKDEFVLIDEQKVAYEQALAYSKKSKEDYKKRVFIINGGPGTGKTVVAINLLVELTQHQQKVAYVTKNVAPRNVFEAKLREGEFKRRNISNLFKGSGSFIESQANDYDTLVVDETHRLNKRTFRGFYSGEDQVKELINASLSTIFFIDEAQRVTAKDWGTKEVIKKWAKHFNAEIYEDHLVSQFRCGGSDGYMIWLDEVLGIQKDTPHPTLKGIDYEFKVVDSPKELKSLVEKKNEEDNKSRLVAGYCWEWASKKDSEIDDIVLEDFAMQWNLSNDPTFAISETSINQIGCIHTTQGLEFNYVGVIIGDDLRYEDGVVITDYKKRATSDKSLDGLKGKANKKDRVALQEIDQIIRNTYRTLMSRGLKGCYVYCTDEKLATYIKEKTGRYVIEDQGYSKVADHD